MSSGQRYSGLIAPLPTPLDAEGSVSASCVAGLVEYLRHDVTGLMPALSTGEGWRLRHDQWLDMVTYTKQVAGDLPVLAGIQLPRTADVVARAQLAAEVGVDAIVVTTPFQAELSQSAIIEHYLAVLRVGVPVFIYNEAAVSGNDIAFETLQHLFELPGIVGIKESSGSAELTRGLVAIKGTVPVFEGWENLLLESTGVDGLIGPLANLEPRLCNAMLKEPSAAVQDEINQVCERLGVFKDDWYAHVKQELKARGIIASAATLSGDS